MEEEITETYIRKINKKKRKVCMQQKGTKNRTRISVDDRSIEEVEQFHYLGNGKSLKSG